MVSTSFEGPPDKPRNPIESILVGGYVFAGVLVAAVVTGIIWFLISMLYGFIGFWLLLGLPLTLGAATTVGYLWRHIDPQDPFSLRKVYRGFSSWAIRKKNKYRKTAQRKWHNGKRRVRTKASDIRNFRNDDVAGDEEEEEEVEENSKQTGPYATSDDSTFS